MFLWGCSSAWIEQPRRNAAEPSIFEREQAEDRGFESHQPRSFFKHATQQPCLKSASSVTPEQANHTCAQTSQKHSNFPSTTLKTSTGNINSPSNETQANAQSSLNNSRPYTLAYSREFLAAGTTTSSPTQTESSFCTNAPLFAPIASSNATLPEEKTTSLQKTSYTSHSTCTTHSFNQAPQSVSSVPYHLASANASYALPFEKIYNRSAHICSYVHQKTHSDIHCRNGSISHAQPLHPSILRTSSHSHFWHHCH